MKTNHCQVCLLAAMLLLPALSFSQHTSISPQKVSTTMEKNKAIIKGLYEKVMNQRDMSLLPEYIAPTFTSSTGGQGVAGFAASLQALIHAFPDIRWTVSAMIAEENKVAVTWTWQGTHQAAFQQFPATGRTITLNGITIYDCQDGKVTGFDLRTDRLAFFTALGVIPPDIATVPAKEQVQFIDKFVVPAAGITEFKERVAVNRHFIKTLPGFITDAAYEYPDEQGNLVYVTIAQWQNKAAVAHAREQVQALYQQEGFDMPGMLKRLGITIDRGLYSRAAE